MRLREFFVQAERNEHGRWERRIDWITVFMVLSLVCQLIVAWRL
jgi:hypothetical protein